MKRLLLIFCCLVSISAGADVVLPIGAAPQILIPVAGSAAGANGTFFRSDITMVNFASHDQQVKLQWLPQVGSGPTALNAVVTIPAGTAIRSSDFVHDYLGVSGLGSIIATGLTATGQIDESALIYAASRIWTPQPGSNNGTTSQSFDALPLASIGTPAAALFGMGSASNPSNFRVNVGIVNVDQNNAQTFSININSGVTPPPAPIVVTLPPLSMQQISLGNGFPSPATQITITNTTASATKSNLWTAYSSTVDNTTGDAWSELAVAGTAP